MNEILTVSKRHFPISYKLQSLQKVLVDEAEFYIEYFEYLKLIETHFNIRFKAFEFDSINNESFHVVNNLASIARNEKLFSYWDGVQTAEIFNSSDEILNNLKKVNEENTPIAAGSIDIEKVEIHGKEIVL